MSLTTLIRKGIGAAFDSPVIENLADKVGAAGAVLVMKEHFTFTAFEIASAYQESYKQALAAISAGLATPEQKLAFLQKFTQSKITREFSEQIDSLYLQPFAKAEALDSIAKAEALDSNELRQQLFEQIVALSKYPFAFEAENTPFTDTELAAFINDKGTLSITDLVLEQLGSRVPDLLAQFFRYHELLGNAILFFLRERLRKDERTEKTLAALQREKLLLGADEIKQAMAEQKALLQELMQRFALSKQIKPSDEFTHHTSDSFELIQAAIAKLSVLPRHNRDYNQLVVMAGSVLSSTGDINNLAKAENLFQQARDLAQNPAEKALACFNLFQTCLRREDYRNALCHLQTAIAIDAPRYARHDVDRYPIIRLLGAGGMGCVFLCHDQWRENQVVVKCFWEGRKGSREDVFGEAMMMRTIAGDYVPKPLDCGYVDATSQERPYFVTEYIEGTEDGETWLAQHGKFDVATGLAVGLQIAKGLQVAHEQGIYHLDLKPANILLQQTSEVSKTSEVSVKIIDFGLARVATSLRQEAISRSSSRNQTQFGHRIIGTLCYAPPEQLGHTEYGPPSAKSDLFSFGATLYRLMTGENPHNLNPRRLAEAPPALFDLLCDCKEENPARRPDSIQQVISILAGIQEKAPKKTDVETLANEKPRSLGKWVLIAGVVVGIFAFAAMLILNNGERPSEESTSAETMLSEKPKVEVEKSTEKMADESQAQTDAPDWGPKVSPHHPGITSYYREATFNSYKKPVGRFKDTRAFLLAGIEEEYKNEKKAGVDLLKVYYEGSMIFFEALIFNVGMKGKTAFDVKMRLEGFHKNEKGHYVTDPFILKKFRFIISASNSVPREVWAEVAVQSGNNAPIRLRYTGGNNLKIVPGGMKKYTYIQDQDGFFGNGTPVGDTTDPIGGRVGGGKMTYGDFYFVVEAVIE